MQGETDDTLMQVVPACPCPYCGHEHALGQVCPDMRNFQLAARLLGDMHSLGMHYKFCACLQYAAQGKPLSEYQVILIIRAWEISNPEDMIDCALWPSRPRDPRIGPLQRPVGSAAGCEPGQRRDRAISGGEVLSPSRLESCPTQPQGSDPLETGTGCFVPGSITKDWLKY